MEDKSYRPGLHILCTFSATADLLKDVNGCKTLFSSLVMDLGLTSVGDVYHSFDSGGFTASVCLTESHVAIHTWPEFGTATFDVFLSNFNRDNSSKVREFYSRTLEHFRGTVLTLNEVER